MRLVFDWAHSNARPAREEFPKALEEAFNLICVDLGLDKHEEDVSVRIRYSLRKQGLILSKKMMGAEDPILKSLAPIIRKISSSMGMGDGGSTEAVPRFPIKMEIIASSYNAMFFTLCHEMIHVQQIVSGRSLYDPKSDSITFDGKHYTREMLLKMSPLELPVEPEAYEKGPQLALRILRKLSDSALNEVVFGGIETVREVEARIKQETEARLKKEEAHA